LSLKIFSDYKACISFLFELERTGIKYDLKNIRRLLLFLNNPQKKFKSIHVAGTNGKGSVSSIINSGLIENKIKTGLYTSPHIKDFRERILVNGMPVSKKFILNFTKKIYDEIQKIKPSFFEVTTALAFDYFAFKKVDYAVIETGLGGRLDSTNIINPILSVITSIDIDHTEFLGKKIENISSEKGGIIKKNIPVVIGKVPDASEKIFKKIVKEKKSELIFSEGKFKVAVKKKTETGFHFSFKKKGNIFANLFFPVIGDYQINNINTALAAFDSISKTEKIIFEEKTIADSMKNLRENSNFYGRFEKISDNPKIVIDVSHNLQGIKNIKRNLNYFRYKKLYVIFGMMSDKDYKNSLIEITKLNPAKIILTKANYKRAADPKIILDSISTNLTCIETKGNVNDAFKYAVNLLNKDDLLLITGSFFLISDFLNLI